MSDFCRSSRRQPVANHADEEVNLCDAKRPTPSKSNRDNSPYIQQINVIIYIAHEMFTK